LAVERVAAPTATPSVEFFWLCDECATRLTLEATFSGVNVVPSFQTGKETHAQFLRLSRTWCSMAASQDIAQEART
jgi:hypothetical protein